MGIVLEPVPALSAMLMSLKMVRFTDAGLAAEVAELEGAVRATKSSDAGAWPPVYRRALAIIPRVLAFTAQAEESKTRAQRAQQLRQKVQLAGSAAQSVLQRASGDWPARLASQERELIDKSQRAVEQLSVEGSPNPATGETVFRTPAADLAQLEGWLQGVVATWWSNNAALVELRTNEAVADVVADLPPEAAFRARKAEMAAPRLALNRLKGFSAPTPGTFDSLSTTYKTVMGTVSSLSGVGFFAARVIPGKVSEVLPWFFGLGFLVAVGTTALTVPQQKRQARARLLARATEHVHRELVDAIKAKIDSLREEQLTAIKKHLLAEHGRWRAAIRDALPDSDGAASAGGVAGFGSGGLLSGDAAKLQGEWKSAIEKRLVELGGAV